MRDKVIVGNAFLDDGFTREIPSAGLCGIIDDLQGLFHRIASSDVELHVPSDWEVMEFSDGCELWEVLYQNPGDYGLSIGQVNDFQGFCSRVRPMIQFAMMISFHRGALRRLARVVIRGCMATAMMAHWQS